MLISLSMIVSGANSTPSVPRSLMSLAEQVNLGLIPKLDLDKNIVIGITTTYGSNDDECFADIIKKAITKVPNGYMPVGIFSAFVNAFAHTDSDGNRYVRSSNIFICGGDALFEKVK
jgi:hypothetical protein